MDIQHRQASSILSKATGFIGSYDYTLNPYSGCAFGCAYCYAAFFARTTAEQETWGQWVLVKDNALELLRKKRKRPLLEQTLYMSSVTDPYQPIERKLELTRALLQELLEYHRVRLVVQTRSPLVMRDIDLLKQFAFVRVNMTVTTDDEDVRKAFEPTCPPNARRLEAIAAVSAAGIPTAITMTPLLPVGNPEAFARALLATGAQKFVVQDFHVTKTRFVAGTGGPALKLAQQMGWNDGQYQRVKSILRAALPNLYEGQAGFVPEW
ncbi:MAG: radical SAM protein [Anaerolineae bacterium]